jgi:methylase of polypeptide subunit release factors
VALVASLLRQQSCAFPKRGGRPSVSVLDLCTGTGCIALHFHNELCKAQGYESIEIPSLGVDISKLAISLARHNQELESQRLERLLHESYTDPLSRCKIQNQISNLSSLQFVQSDILDPKFYELSLRPIQPSWDVILANPPYISPEAFERETERSVRNFEPKIALVPPPISPKQNRGVSQGELFYPRLLEIADEVNAKVVAFEVGDTAQALTVRQLVQDRGAWDGVAILGDHMHRRSSLADILKSNSEEFVKGQDTARALLCWRSEAADWLGHKLKP